MENLSLAEAIQKLRQELIRAIDQGKDEAIRFAVGPIELELEVDLMVGGGAKAEFKWVVVSVGAEAKGEARSRHRVKLTLNPVDVKAGTERVLVAEETIKPR